MQVIDITAQLTTIDFAPQNELAEIIQNIKALLTTAIFSVPLDREIGLNVSMLDQPIQVAQAKLTAQIIEKIHKYEPRVRISKVLYEGDPVDGILKPTVRVVIK